jgi:hypothetical protein
MMGLMDVSIIITLDYNNSHTEFLFNDICLADLTMSGSRTGLQSLEFSIRISESRTKLTSCGPNIDHRLQGFSSAVHVCVVPDTPVIPW